MSPDSMSKTTPEHTHMMRTKPQSTQGLSVGVLLSICNSKVPGFSSQLPRRSKPSLKLNRTIIACSWNKGSPSASLNHY
eukprot:1142854-Pelagomonas_calceolata.AAC.9